MPTVYITALRSRSSIMGKKSRRVRGAGATPASKPKYVQVNTLVAWMDGDTKKQTLGLDMARGKTIRDVKVKLEASTGVPVARQALTRQDKLLGGEIEVPDHVTVDEYIESGANKEPFIMREREKKRAGRQLPMHDVPPPKPLSAYELFTTAIRAQTSRAAVKYDAATLAAQFEAMPDAFKIRWHDGATKEQALYACHRRICSMSGELLVGQFFRDAREGGRGLGRVLSILEMNPELDVDALAYHVVFDDMKLGGETLSLRELRWRICGDARAARRAAKRSYVVADAENWRTRHEDMSRDEREIPRMSSVAGGRPISPADMDRLNEATASIRQELEITYPDVRKAFQEYSNMIILPRFRAAGLLGALKAIENWPRFRPYWHRVRRRVCAHCFKRADLSEPRYLVCSGCGEARYCSEACQRAHWAEHQKKCPAGRHVLYTFH